MDKQLLESFRRQLAIFDAFEKELHRQVILLNHEAKPSTQTARDIAAALPA